MQPCKQLICDESILRRCGVFMPFEWHVKFNALRFCELSKGFSRSGCIKIMRRSRFRYSAEKELSAEADWLNGCSQKIIIVRIACCARSLVIIYFYPWTLHRTCSCMTHYLNLILKAAAVASLRKTLYMLRLRSFSFTVEWLASQLSRSSSKHLNVEGN